MVMGFGFYPPRYNTREAPPPQRPVWGPPDVSQQLQQGIGGLAESFTKGLTTVQTLKQQAALDESRRLSSEAIGAAAGGQSPGAVLLGMGQQYQQPAGPAPGPSYGSFNTGGKLPSFARAPESLSPDLKTMISAKEEQYGLPGGFLQKTAWIESKGDPNARNPNSSAAGLFQQIDSNWKSFGDPNGSRFDPVASTDAAARFAVYNQQTLRNALGREPTAGELYLAHQQGAGGAVKLLSNPDERAADLVGAKAVRLNGGDMSMTAGQFASRWTSKIDSDPQAVAPPPPGPIEAATAPRPAYQLASNNPSFVPADPTLAPKREDQEAAAMVVNAQTAQKQQQQAAPPGFMGLPSFAQNQQPGGPPVSTPVMQMPEGQQQAALTPPPVAPPRPQAAAPAQTVPNPFQQRQAPPAPSLPPQAAMQAPAPPPPMRPQGVGYRPPAPGALQPQGQVDPRLIKGLQAAVRAGDSTAVSAIQTLISSQQRQAQRANFQLTTLPNGETVVFNPETAEIAPVGYAGGVAKAPETKEVGGRLYQWDGRQWSVAPGTDASSGGPATGDVLLPPGDPRRQQLGIREDGRTWKLGLDAKGRQTIDPIANEPARDDKNFQQADKLRTEYLGQTTDQQKALDAYGRVEAAIANPTPTPGSQMALIFGYMKMLDPGSVVREGEYATAQNAASIPERIRNMYNKALEGNFLSGEQEQDFVEQSFQLQKANVKKHNAQAKRFRKLAQMQNLDPELIAEEWEMPERAPTRPKAEAAPTSAPAVRVQPPPPGATSGSAYAEEPFWPPGVPKPTQQQPGIQGFTSPGGVQFYKVKP